MDGIIKGRCEWLRQLDHDQVNPIVRRHAAIELKILEQGPKDKEEIRKIITELKAKRDATKDSAEKEVYLSQLDAYEMLESLC